MSLLLQLPVHPRDLQELVVEELILLGRGSRGLSRDIRRECKEAHVTLELHEDSLILC